MKKLDQVLSNAEIANIVFSCDWSRNKDQQMACIIARGLEQAVLAKLAEQEPVAWRVHPFDYGVGVEGAYAMTQQKNQMQAWISKGWEVTPLYLLPTLPIEPSDELIAEIKAMADMRLVDGRVELSNVKEIIHAIVHHPIYAN